MKRIVGFTFAGFFILGLVLGMASPYLGRQGGAGLLLSPFFAGLFAGLAYHYLTQNPFIELFVIVATMVALVLARPVLRRLLVFVLCLPFALFFTVTGNWIGLRWSDVAVRYRMTIVAETDGVVHEGSGVLGVSCGYSPTLDEGSTFCRFSGEAIPIDLGDHGLLFMTLYGRQVNLGRPRGTVNTDPTKELDLVFSNVWGNSSDYLSGLRALKRERPKADLSLDLLPLLVRFRNIKDLRSVEKVDPDHLDQAFGPGARIVSATIEVTDDPVTTGIEKVLPWWNGPWPFLKPLGNGVFVDMRVGFKVNKEDFKQGDI